MGYTEISVQKFSFSWTVSNFGFLLWEMREAIKNPTFLSGTSDKGKWCLKVLANGIISPNVAQLSKRPVWARFQFGIMSVDGEKTKGMISPRFLKFTPNQHKGFQKVHPLRFALVSGALASPRQ